MGYNFNFDYIYCNKIKLIKLLDKTGPHTKLYHNFEKDNANSNSVKLKCLMLLKWTTWTVSVHFNTVKCD